MIHLGLAIFASSIYWTLNERQRWKSFWNLERCWKTTHLIQKEIHIRWFCDMSTSKAHFYNRLERDKETPHRQMICCSLRFYWGFELCTNITTQATHLLQISKYIYPRIMRNIVTISNYTTLFACPFYFYFNFNSERFSSTFLWQNVNDFYYVVICIEIRLSELRLFIYLTMNDKRIWNRVGILLRET